MHTFVSYIPEFTEEVKVKIPEPERTRYTAVHVIIITLLLLELKNKAGPKKISFDFVTFNKSNTVHAI